MPSDPSHIFIGNNVYVTAGVRFINHDMMNGMLNRVLGTNEFKYTVKDIHIEDNVVVNANALILPGVTIHKNCIIGAGAVVSKDIPENSVAAGNPIRVIETLDEYITKKRCQNGIPLKGE